VLPIVLAHLLLPAHPNPLPISPRRLDGYLDNRQQLINSFLVVVDYKGFMVAGFVAGFVAGRFPIHPTFVLPDQGLSEMKKGKPDLLHGTLELLILKTLALGDLHGWAISKHIHQLSDDVLEVGQGSLYPALYRLEDRGWIQASWGVAETGRRAKFYSLTKQGRKRLDVEKAHWNAFHTAVNKVLATE